MLERQQDWSAFQRLDNAGVVDFLTSAAGALSERGLIGAKDTDNLRLVLSGINSGAATREQPILLVLERQNADFLGLLTARYGTAGLCRNLLRHTLRGPVDDARRLLADWGQALLKKAELLFNRSLNLADARPRDRQALLSTLIVDLSETIASACAALEEAQAELWQMNPHAMAGASDEDDATDLAVAKACGFKDVLRPGLPGAGERAAKRRIAAAIQLVAEEALALAAQIGANAGAAGAGYGMVATCEQLVAESHRLALLDLPATDAIMHWEVRRRSIVSTVASIGDALRQLTRESLEALAPDMLAAAALPAGLYPESARRRVAFALLAGGVPTAKAWTATADIFRYLEAHRLTPSEVLPGELTKINPALTIAALEALGAATNDQAFMSRALPEKSATLGRAKRLAAAFATALALGTTGCGLKTNPKSDVPDLRPDIQFHAPAPAPAPKDPTTK